MKLPQGMRRPPRSLQQFYRFLMVALVSGGLYLASQILQWDVTEGIVVSVADGDTLTLATGRGKIRIRLAGIDAPEKNQPFGPEAKAALANLCLRQHARAEVRDHDRYGRAVAVVYCQEKNANAEQVRQGMAWIYDDYARPDSELSAGQEEARQKKLGLWRGRKPVPPWEYRRARQRNTTSDGVIPTWLVYWPTAEGQNFDTEKTFVKIISQVFA